MQKIYSYFGKTDTVELMREAFQKALERREYDCEVDVVGPIAPHVYAFRKDGNLISVVVDDTVGEKWEASLTVETEQADDDVSAIVAEAVRTLLADLSTLLIESVTDATTRARIVDDLSGVLATLK
jgi:hypothetical protein